MSSTGSSVASATRGDTDSTIHHEHNPDAAAQDAEVTDAIEKVRILDAQVIALAKMASSVHADMRYHFGLIASVTAEHCETYHDAAAQMDEQVRFGVANVSEYIGRCKDLDEKMGGLRHLAQQMSETKTAAAHLRELVDDLLRKSVRRPR
eukprot:TRINITY_DN22743_c0_g1_i1.p1 TRINITY_DN22743_c0_g1~~TRINITY_DN22743_c0_g1_i1.p1  ORF type:complete len:150 (-),score=13.37 TRINITY_DN22743_c0_g1_i1:115-564(-)